MKSIGIVICNFNKKDYIVNCIKSVLNQSTDDFDLYVVDNASTDGSVEEIKKEFGNSINLIINKNNIGGSGGFNTGIRKVLEKNYKYIMCVDNDIVMDKNNVENLYNFLEKNQDVSLVGSKIYMMDDPEIVMALGSKIDYDIYEYRDNYKGCKDSDELPSVVYCDYVPACSLMARRSVVDNIGLMRESNFIYWDDIDWAIRMSENGYKIAAIGEAKVWHKGGGANPTNTFPDYYFWRNKIDFFIRHLKDNEIERFINVLLEQLFQFMYGAYYKGKTTLIKTLKYAYEDAIHGVCGKADEYKILSRYSGNEKDILKENIKNVFNILLELPDNFFIGDSIEKNYTETFKIEKLVDVIKQIFYINNKVKISLLNCRKIYSIQDIENELKKRNLQCKDRIKIINEAITAYDLKIKLCNHVVKINEFNNDYMYIDKFNNCIATQEQYNYYKNYNNMLNIFIEFNREFLKSQINKLRENEL